MIPLKQLLFLRAVLSSRSTLVLGNPVLDQCTWNVCRCIGLNPFSLPPFGFPTPLLHPQVRNLKRLMVDLAWLYPVRTLYICSDFIILKGFAGQDFRKFGGLKLGQPVNRVVLA